MKRHGQQTHSSLDSVEVSLESDLSYNQGSEAIKEPGKFVLEQNFEFHEGPKRQGKILQDQSCPSTCSWKFLNFANHKSITKTLSMKGSVES